MLIVSNDIQGTADDLKNHVAVSIPPSPQRMNSGGSTRSQNYGQAKLLFAIKKVSSLYTCIKVHIHEESKVRIASK